MVHQVVNQLPQPPVVEQPVVAVAPPIVPVAAPPIPTVVAAPAAAHSIEVSPQAKALAEDKLKQVFVVQDDTPDPEKVKIAKEPVSYIQEIVKKKKEEAKEILAIKEEEAKKEIDKIVRIKKDWDKLQEE